MDETDWDDTNDEIFKAPKHSSITDKRKDIDIDIDIDAFVIGDPIKIKEEIVIKPPQVVQKTIRKNIPSKTLQSVNNNSVQTNVKKAGSQIMLKCYYCKRETRSNKQNEFDDQILCNRCEKFEY